MRFLLTFLFLLLLVACGTPRIHVPPTVKRDWSKFVRPPAGTPCLLMVYAVRGRQIYQIAIPGTWGDGNPWRVKFVIPQAISGVRVAQIIHKGEPISTITFPQPVTFEKGSTWGYQRGALGN